jgi:galactosylceramidase
MNDTGYIKDVDILGFHYPRDDSDIWPDCSSIGLPIWSSEESSSYDDLNGAACWARVLASHYVLHNMTANIMWSLVGAYYHGTNWYASAMLTAVQPWSGYFESEQMPVVWATAHYTQFIQPGWKYLPVGKGSGELAKGGYYTTLVSPDLKYFTVIVVKISRDHAECTRPSLWNWDTEEELFQLKIDMPEISIDMGTNDGQTQTWYSNFEQEDTVLFQKLDQQNNTGLSRVYFAKSGQPGIRSYDISLNVTVGGIFTVTNQMNVGNKGEAKNPRAPDARFPLPYSDDFSSYGCDNCYPNYLTDQMGAFEIQFVDDGKRLALVQMAPNVPVGWVPYRTGPWTLMGMTEWEDVSVEVSFRLPDPATYACVSTRADQHWRAGVSMCANTSDWYLIYGGAPLEGFDQKAIIEHGTVSNTLLLGDWHKLGVATMGHRVEGLVNDQLVGKHSSIRVGDCGFVALGTSAYTAVQFGQIKIKSIGPKWVTPKSSSPVMDPGLTWTLTLGLCTPNGLTTDLERFTLMRIGRSNTWPAVFV